ncbi:MAG: methyltransferase [Acidimicrobiia bacterium]|nr:methyltransferase [Acidimicrobiia bacterium]
MSSGHYFDAEPAVPSRRRRVALSIPDLDAELVTDTGVFSHDRVDPGTKLLLLEGPPTPPGATHLLDLGCGYGPLAVALAHRAPGATVWAVDVNARARALCRENAAERGLENVVVVAPDEMPDDVRLDAVFSNPPVRIGKARLHDLLTHWLHRLAPGRGAHLVVARNLGADSLAAWLDSEGWSTRRRASRRGYRLLDVQQPSAGR